MLNPYGPSTGPSGGAGPSTSQGPATSSGSSVATSSSQSSGSSSSSSPQSQKSRSGTPRLEGADTNMTESAPPSSTGTVAAAPPTEILAGPTVQEAPRPAVAATTGSSQLEKSNTTNTLGRRANAGAPPQASATAVAVSVKPDIKGDTSSWTVSYSSPSTSTSSSDSLRSFEVLTTSEREAVARDPQSPL